MIGPDVPQSPGAVRASVLVSLAALSTLAVGALILGGGAERFANPSFQTARGIAPWWAWGVAMLASGTLATAGAVAHLSLLSRIGHSLSSVVYLFLVMAFVDAAMKVPNAALTGIGIYTGFALIHAFSAASADLEKDTREAAKATKEAREANDAALAELERDKEQP